jgi:tRNA-dihydrouridine synthase A
MTAIPKTTNPHISIAPMMDWTDRHYRYFMRQFTPNTRLYTEMITTGALLHGDADRFLRFNTDCENPLALQLGGSDPKALAQAAKLGERYGYDEINLNCGCPSDRVQNGMFGACLMKNPDLVADCFESMQNAVDIPVTIKCRIGVDELDSAEFLYNFVDKSVERGCKTFILHARKAWLKGLSPKQNREIPELNYQRVYDLKQKYPQLEIILNGGITDIETVKTALLHVDGVMIGREAYHNPYFFAQIEREIFGNDTIPSREDIAANMIPYARKQAEIYDTPVKSITRHILGLYHDCQGSKRWRRALSTLPYEDGADEQVIQIALDAMIDFQENENLKKA